MTLNNDVIVLRSQTSIYVSAVLVVDYDVAIVDTLPI